ncbi:MAG: helix-turn-helix domain-containing protein [Deltaproteobacteria bacterium]|nr:helix-turn-helix domain-containing protein [Deltaproteobacteria bacterium]
MAQSYRRIESVTKTLEILEYLAAQKEPVSGPDIARAVGLPVGTIMCHVMTLEERNFIQRIGDRFRLGMMMAILWARVKSSLETQRDRIDRDLESISIPGGN